ncbi:CBO0543 family protein [Ornithinibacillus salinisoli]|uniref:CBO0543 family protein n=1 Tax=Ornithinibacillus salinisoli TaxID=1848459 RepID=A0ABW4W6G8_9BACI
MSREQLLKEIETLDAKLMVLVLEHWNRFGDFSSWQFWFTVAFFILPLIVTIICIDKKKIFQIAFYGYSFHIMFVYLDVFFARNNFWAHPYHMIPFVPVSIPIDGAFIPVAFMLAYQYAINRNKNFYLVSLITAIAISIIAFIWIKLELLVLYKGMNIFHIFLLDIGMSILAYWFTALFLKLKKT